MTTVSRAGAPRTTAVVVTYGHADEIGDCLEALLAQEVCGGLEVVVVDNASSDGTCDVVRGFGDRVRLVALDRNTGYAEATNTAAALAGGELLLLLNPDCVVDPGCVQTLVDRLDSTPGVGAAAALLRYPDGRPQEFARRDLALRGVLWDLTELGRRYDKRRGDRGRKERRYTAEFTGTGPSEPLEVDCPAAACVLVWRAPCGPQVMSPELPLFYNDGDLYSRLRVKGYRVEVVPAATAAHAYSTSLQRVPAAGRRAEFVACMRVYARRWWPLRRRVLLWLLLALDATTAGLVSFRGRDRARARAHARGTLGGLGLPLGTAPWLARVPPWRDRPRLSAVVLREAWWSWLTAARRRSRRRRVVRRLRREAWLSRTTIDVRIDRTADVAADLHVELRRGRPAALRLGPRAVVQRGVVLRLWGGELVMGHGAQVRYGAVLTAKGRLELGPRVAVSRGVNLHADGDMVLEFGVGVAEGATVLDTEHRLGTVLPVFDLPVEQADVRIGAGAFIGANAVVTAGVSVGRRSVVGAGSVVTHDVPEGVLVAGSPARVVREI